ncbi:MAG: hypothetical protein WCQ00_03705 [bacterium]
MATKKQPQHVAAGFVKEQDGFEGLGTSDAQWAIQNPEMAVALAVEAIRSRHNTCPPRILLRQKEMTFVPRGVFTIQTGGSSAIELHAQAMERKMNDGNKEAIDMIQKIGIVMERPQFTTFVVLSLSDLSNADRDKKSKLKFTIERRHILKKSFLADWSKEHLDGQILELCHKADGPQICLQYQAGQALSGQTLDIVMAQENPICFTEEGAINPSYITFRLFYYLSGGVLLCTNKYGEESLFSSEALVMLRLREMTPED